LQQGTKSLSRREEILSRVTSEQMDAFKRDGVVHLKQVMSKEWLMLLELGKKRNLANPGPEACTIFADSPDRSFYDATGLFSFIGNDYLRAPVGLPPTGRPC
jgi:hypothetical protein